MRPRASGEAGQENSKQQRSGRSSAIAPNRLAEVFLLLGWERRRNFICEHQLAVRRKV
jgi:hypothetical protein